MRKINTQDVFKLARLIKAAGIKDIVSNMFASGLRISKEIQVDENASEEEKKKAKQELDRKQEEFGVNAIFTLLENCCSPDLEKKVYDLVAGITEKTPDAVMNQSLEVTIDDVKEIAKNNNIIDFFKKASQLNL